MPPIEWSDSARFDLEELDKFLHRNSPDAAVRALMAIFDATDQLEAFPESGRPAEGRSPGERELVIPFGRGGYVLLYRVRDDLVIILGVKHQLEAGY